MHEALRMCGVHRVQGCLPYRAHLLDATEVHICGGEQRQARVVMLVVVPAEELSVRTRSEGL